MVDAEVTCRVKVTGPALGAMINLLSTVVEGKDPYMATKETVLTADGLALVEASLEIVEETTVEG